MYKEQKSIDLSYRISPIFNNLSIFVVEKQSLIYYVTVSKQFIILVSSAIDGHTVNQRVIECKEPNSRYSSTVMQAKLIQASNKLLLAVCASNGFEILDADSTAVLFWHSFSNDVSSEIECYSRGICNIGDEKICCGTWDGKILMFNIPKQGTNFQLKSSLRSHSHAITDLFSNSEYMLSGDEQGQIVVWQIISNTPKQLVIIEGNGFLCTSLIALYDTIIAGFTNGLINLFNIKSGIHFCEISAHTRLITSLDVCENERLFVSASEDCTVKVWKFSTEKKVEMVHNQPIDDVMIHGAKFVGPRGFALACVGYDYKKIFFYSAI